MFPFDQMMGNAGGLAQTMFYGQQCGFDNRLMELYRQQQKFIPSPMCLHGVDCPKCRENREVVAKYHKDQAELATLKKRDYENRCIEYMKRFK